MRLRMTTIAAGLGAALLALATLPATGAAQQRAHLGLRAGYNFDFEDPAVGGHLALPIVRRLDFYPSVDVFLPETGTRMLFNGDLKYRFATASAWEPYLGGGINILYRRVAGSGGSEPGGNLLGGIETRVGNVHPFFEGRIVLQDNTSFQLTGGLNIALGRW
jgi:hypothetical protein